MLIWGHDVNGWGPNFNQGSKSVELSLTALYKDRYEATLKTKNYFGGDYNYLVDRDFVSLSMGVKF